MQKPMALIGVVIWPSNVKKNDRKSKKATQRAAFLCCPTQERQGWQKRILHPYRPRTARLRSISVR